MTTIGIKKIVKKGRIIMTKKKKKKIINTIYTKRELAEQRKYE